MRERRVSPGMTKYPFRKMLLFALNAIVSFSSFPLRLAYIMVFGLSALLISYLVYTFCMHAFYHVLTGAWMDEPHLIYHGLWCDKSFLPWPYW